MQVPLFHGGNHTRRRLSLRTIRQIVDLLRQIERIGLDQTLRESARIAGEAMFRGIVVGNEAL